MIRIKWWWWCWLSGVTVCYFVCVAVVFTWCWLIFNRTCLFVFFPVNDIIVGPMSWVSLFDCLWLLWFFSPSGKLTHSPCVWENRVKKERGVNKNRKLICHGTCLVQVWLCVCVLARTRKWAAAQEFWQLPSRLLVIRRLKETWWRQLSEAAFFPQCQAELKSFNKKEEKKKKK